MDFDEMGSEEAEMPADENEEIDEYAEEERVYSPDEVFEMPQAEKVGPAMAVAIAEAPKKKSGWRIFIGIVLGLSVLMNLMLLIAEPLKTALERPFYWLKKRMDSMRPWGFIHTMQKTALKRPWPPSVLLP